MAKRWYHKRFKLGSVEEKALREIGRIYGIPISFQNKQSWCSGFSYGEDGVIIFLKDPDDGTIENIRCIISSVMHEIAHAVVARRGKFKYYSNQQDDIKKMTRKALRAICQTGFRAECYVEKVGKELTDLHFPGIPYKYGYEWGDAKDRKWLYKNYLKQYGDELKRRRKL